MITYQQKKRSFRPFVFSLLLHSIALVMILQLKVPPHRRMTKQYISIPLEPPSTLEYVPPIRSLVRGVSSPVHEVLVPVRHHRSVPVEVLQPKIVSAATVQPTVRTATEPTPVSPPLAALAKGGLIVNALTNPALTSRPNRPAPFVHIGEFSDPNAGTRNKPELDRRGVATAAGGFDPEPGNGAVARWRGPIENTSFANGIATTDPRNAHRQMGTTEFGRAALPPTATTFRRVAEREEPVSILVKPAPVYTDDARQARVEGEVVINVVFQANGQVHVVGVAKGLGFGLDAAAIRAVEHIRFIPARRNGQHIDYAATLHIVFALS